MNIFGGIVNTATIANGLVKVLRDRDINIPLVVRLEGMNYFIRKSLTHFLNDKEMTFALV